MLKFRLYYDKDEEEQWLEKMSLEGWAFKKFFLGFYTFEPCVPGEYKYQIDLLDNWVGDKAHFSSFMEELGIEVIGQWWRWVYLKKKAIDGPFELYTDAESKITQYRKIRDFFAVFTILELICFLIELVATVETGSILYGSFTVVIALICFAMLRIVWKTKWKIMQLKRDVI